MRGTSSLLRILTTAALVSTAGGFLLLLAWRLPQISPMFRLPLPAAAAQDDPTPAEDAQNSQESQVTSAPVSQPPHPQPASAPTDALGLAVQGAKEQWQARLGEGFSVLTWGPFVVAGNLPPEKIQLYLDDSIIRPAEAMWSSYFAVRPSQPIVVLLFSDGASYRNWAEKLFGDKSVSYFGYYRTSERVLLMNISTGGGTLVHELTHALIAFDWPGVPLWFNEGLASLHEQSRVESGQISGLPNWRLPAIQKAIQDNTLVGLDTLTQSEFSTQGSALAYAHARYFCMYLQSRGLLEKFYRRYKDDATRQVPAIRTIEAVTGQPIRQVDKAYRQYVLSLKWE